MRELRVDHIEAPFDPAEAGVEAIDAMLEANEIAAQADDLIPDRGEPGNHLLKPLLDALEAFINATKVAQDDVVGFVDHWPMLSQTGT